MDWRYSVLIFSFPTLSSFCSHGSMDLYWSYRLFRSYRQSIAMTTGQEAKGTFRTIRTNNNNNNNNKMKKINIRFKYYCWI